jgi:hypothetical protein
LRREVAAQRVQLGLELTIEHYAHHGHARRPLRHPVEIGVTELRHLAASTPESREHYLRRRGRHRMLYRHPLDQIAVGHRHFVILS